mmetsp:Transcript_6707/g.9672  ORF Transcript_6707/g.9672 Transcript_6707/m.9672 type:complete len:171 (-) Transcript_6707:374-886(-)
MLLSYRSTKYRPSKFNLQSPTTVKTRTVFVKKIIPSATLPKPTTPGSIAYNIFTTRSQTIFLNQTAKLLIGESAQILKDIYIHIADQSSIVAMIGLSVIAGVIDPDCRGEISICIRNTTSKPINITTKLKIAQLTFESASTLFLKEKSTLNQTTREGGLVALMDKNVSQP